ncbi:MAG: VWA domain-containing protein [candidate division KSB1 bacterium]|nr:VWA domain-containing protein [candidate division KSB1 bacterium]
MAKAAASNNRERPLSSGGQTNREPLQGKGPSGQGGQLVIHQQGGQGKVKGFADVVFVLDRSGSMESCIEAVKNHIGTFVNSLVSDPRLSSVDWRVGFVAFDDSDFYVLDFTRDITRFQNGLDAFDTGGSELTLPALDVALDFAWRPEAQRVVILFTDEPMDGGEEIPLQLSHFEGLRKKVVTLSIKLFYYGPQCPTYAEFAKLPGSCVQFVDLHSNVHTSADFKKILEQMSKTISGTLTMRAAAMGRARKDLYNVTSIVSLHRL